MTIFRSKKSENVSNKPTRYFSSKQERFVAESINGNITKNSGATTFNPGDIESKHFLIECKTKMKSSQSISIKKEWLNKIKAESAIANKPYTALIFNFGPDEENYAIIDLQLFNLLQELINNGMMD